MSASRHTAILVQDLCCATEESKIRTKFSHVDGVRSVDVNFVTHRLIVEHTTSDEALLSALRSIGLPGNIDSGRSSAAPPSRLNRQRWMFAIAVATFAIGLLLTLFGVPPVVAHGVILAGIVLAGWEIAVKGWRSLMNRTLDINVLMTVAVIGALALGQFSEAAAVIGLYALSLLLEAMSMDRTRHAIRSLVKLSPQTATLIRDGSELLVPTERLAVGDVIRVKPGERIPADGVVVDGVSTVDQSTITGESFPVVRGAGDGVFAGTFNQRGVLTVSVARHAHDSRLAQIVHLVEEAESKRAERHTFVERFARYYTPAVFVLALGVSLIPPLLFSQPFTEWIYRALVLLVISCPCALVISTPVTLVSAITNAARHGILVKGGRHLESLGSIQALAIDKTGTLTRAQLSVTDVIGLNGTSERDVIRLSAALELQSEHHLADALLARAADDNGDIPEHSITAFESIPGRGVRATVDGRRLALGNHELAEELGICSPRVEALLETLERQGKTVIILSDAAQALGVIALSDTVRHESRDAISALHGLGVRPVVLLTGDNATAATAVGESLGVDEVRAGLLPQEKSAAVRALAAAHGAVGMVGDGVNDAPALASASVGIAMGAAGSDTAIEAADVVLMSDNLLKVPHAIALGRKAIRIIRQNIALALVVKGAFLLLGVLGWTSLWLAILADDGVTLLVILNSLRTLRIGEL